MDLSTRLIPSKLKAMLIGYINWQFPSVALSAMSLKTLTNKTMETLFLLRKRKRSR